MTRQQAAAPPRRKWLWVVAAAAVAGGIYLFGYREAHAPAPIVVNGSPAAAPAAAPAPLPPRGNGGFPAGVTVTEQKVVELNTATLAEIETLPGITPDYARKIIAARPYQSMSDLARTGIPRAVLDEISPPAVIRTTQRGLTPARGPR